MKTNILGIMLILIGIGFLTFFFIYNIEHSTEITFFRLVIWYGIGVIFIGVGMGGLLTSDKKCKYYKKCWYYENNYMCRNNRGVYHTDLVKGDIYCHHMKEMEKIK